MKLLILISIPASLLAFLVLCCLPKAAARRKEDEIREFPKWLKSRVDSQEFYDRPTRVKGSVDALAAANADDGRHSPGFTASAASPPLRIPQPRGDSSTPTPPLGYLLSINRRIKE
jgi:hypothetical protein